MASKNNEVVHMRIDFDGTKAQRGMDAIALSYDLIVEKRKALSDSIKESSKEITKLKKELKEATTKKQKDAINAQIGEKSLLIEQAKEQEKIFKTSEKMMKEMQKRTSITYKSIIKELENIAHVSLHDLEVYYRQLDTRLKNYSPDTKYGRKMIQVTRNAMAEIEAEMKGRNRGTAGAGNYFRPFTEIMNDFKNKPQSISTLKALREEMERFYNAAGSQSGRNFAFLALKEMDKALADMNLKPMRDLRSMIDQFDSMEKGSNISGLKALREEVERFKMQATDADQIKGAVKLIGDIDKQLADMTKLPKRPVDVVLGELANAKSIESIEKLKNEIQSLLRTTENAGEQQKLTNGLKQADDMLKKITADTMSLEQARRIANGQELASIEKMEEALKVIENAWKQTSMDSHIFKPAELDAEKQKLAELKAELDRLNQKRAEGNAQYLQQVREIKERTKASLDGRGGARREMNDFLDNADYFNRTNTLTRMRMDGKGDTEEYKQLEKAFEEDGRKYQTLKEKVAAEKSAAIAEMRQVHQQANAANQQIIVDIENQKRLVSEQEQRIVNGTTSESTKRIEALKGEQKQLQETVKRLAEMPKYTEEQLARAQGIGRGQITPMVSELTEAKRILEAYKGTLNTTDIKLLDKVRDEIKFIDSEIDRVNGKTKELMSEEAAVKAVGEGKTMLARIRKYGATSVDASEVRALAESTKQAQSAQNASLELTREAAAVNRELNEVLSAQNQIVLAESTIKLAEKDAEDLLRAGKTANVGILRETIDVYKLIVQQQNQDVATRQKNAATLKQLEELYKCEVKVLIDVEKAKELNNRADEIIKDSTGVMVGEVNDLIKSLRILKEQSDTTLQDASKIDGRIKALEALMRKVSQSTKDLAYDEQFVSQTLANLKTAPVEHLERAMAMLRRRMSDAETGLVEYVSRSRDLKKVKDRIDDLNGSLKKQEDFMSRGMAKLMQYLGIFGGFYLVRNKMQEAIKANMDYDDSLTNIRKTTGLTSESVKMLADNIKKIDTRTSLADMNELAYSAGRLGVKGVSDVMAFVKSANILKVALGEQLGEGSEAVEQLLKVTTIMGTTREYGMEDALLKTGAAINHLTMNSQATAQPMVDFLKRTAGLATQAGVTTDALVGLAGAVNALGQPVEMSATSVSKMMVQISKNSLGVARALQMTNEETEKFIYQISAGDMMDAFITMLRKVGEQGGLSHLSTIIKDLGGEGQRVIQTLSTLSANVDLVENMVRMSTQAFEEGTSAIDEYNIKNENTVALMERLKNSFSKMMVSTEAVSFMHDILVDMQGLPKAAKQVVDSFQFVGDILSWVAKQISENTHYLVGLLQAMAARTVVTFAANLSLMAGEAVKGGAAIVMTTINLGKMAVQLTVTALTLGKFTLGLNTANWSFKNLLTSAKNFFNFLKSAQFGNVFTAVAAVAFAFYEKVAQKSRESAQALKENQELLENVKEQAKQQTASVNTLLDRLQKAWDKTDERKNILLELNNTYGDYIGNLIDENAGYEQIEQTLKAVNEQLRMKSLLEARDKRLSEITSENSTELGTKRGNVLSTIASFISGEGSNAKNAASSELLRRMLQVDASTGRMRAYDFFDFDVDAASGVASNFRVKKDAGTRGMSQTVINDFLQLMRGVVDEQVKKEAELGNTVDLDVQNRRKTSWGNTETVYGQVLYQLQEFLNTNAGVEEKKYNAAQGFQTDIDDAASRAQDYFVKTEKDLWSSLGDVISDSGNLADHVAKTISESGKREKDYWVTRKAQLVKDGKLAEEEKQVKNYATAARAVVEEMRGKGWANEALYNQAKQRVASGNTQDGDKARIENYEKYLQQYYRQMNAEEYLRVLRPGNIEQKPDEKAADKAARDAKQEMDNLIQKIKTFYEIQANAYKEMRQKQQITETEYQRYLEQNNRDMSASLADAYAALAQDADMTEERYKQITERMREENKRSGAGAIGETQIGIVSGTSYASVQNINKQLSGDKENGTAWTNSMRRKRREEEGNVIESLNKEMQARIKAWLEQNPLGKIAQDFQKQFEELGLLIHIQPEVDVDGTVKRDLARVEDDLMQQMLEIGKRVSEFDMTTDDGRKKFAEFVNDLKKFPDVAKTAVLKTAEDIEAFYYKAYEFAEQYEETITRIAEKNRKMWEKMYKHTNTYIDQVKELKAISEAIKLSDRMVQYGGSSMRAQAQKVGESQQKYDMVNGVWQNDIVQAQAEVAGAEALVAAGAPMAEERLREAREQLEIISQMPDEVRTAAEALNDAMMTLADSAFSFAGEMVSAFEKLADGMVPLRSWYEDKGSFVENVFGTKEERQQAFGAYMDDLKKTIRKTTQEQARLITQEAVMKAMARRKDEIEKRKSFLKEQQIETEGLAAKEIIRKADEMGYVRTEQAKNAASDQGTNQRIGNDTKEANAGMWGNFGKAISAAWADGGPYLGAILAAMVAGVLGSLMTTVMNMMGSSSKSTAAAPKTKLVSGMLTYDSGNVQSFRGIPTYDGGGSAPNNINMLPVMGDDGRVYMVPEGDMMGKNNMSGFTGIVRRPTLTTVGGAPALVAERGPEMVIGRETTHAMMMSRPDLLRAIVEFDRNRSRGFAKTFDSGNVGDMATVSDGSTDGSNNSQLMEVLDAQTAMLSQMYEINAALTAELRKGIGVRKYGAGGLIEETAAGFAEARRLGNNKNVTRLFGSR